MTRANPTLGSGGSLDEFRWFCYFLLTSALHLGAFGGDMMSLAERSRGIRAVDLAIIVLALPNDNFHEPLAR